MSLKKIILLLSHLLSLVLLGFGLFKDMLQVNISAHFIVEFSLFKENRSIMGALQSLWQSGNYLPYSLILIFGIILPLLKSSVIFYLLLAKNPGKYYYTFIYTISKWAMSDVFAISIFVAFLGANAMENTKAVILNGYYYFTTYVLLSAIITHLLVKKDNPRN